MSGNPEQRRAAGRGGLAVLLALGVLACADEDARALILVTLDTTRADALGAYGCQPSVTPVLDRIAAEGVVYEHAYTSAPLTLPAHASMLTGLYPLRHGVRDNGVMALPRSAVTLAERAQAAGFQTAAFLGSVVLDEGFGLEQGFDRYEPPARHFYGRTMGYAERPAMEVARLASSWLHGRDPRRPFFLWVHLWDAHAPYAPAPAMLARAGGNAYLGEVAACDQALGLLLAALEEEHLSDSVALVIAGDHGEAFGEHGEYGHGPFVWNTTLHVPLIVRHPGGAHGGERVEAVTSLVDVFPTALEAMGLARAREAADGVDGVSLWSDPPAAARGVYFESYYGFLEFGWHPLAGWIDRAGKYVHSARPRFFELAGDPDEARDLLPESPARAADPEGPIAALARLAVLARDAEAIDPELKRSLQAVGYAAFATEGARCPAPLERLELPDPLERVADVVEFQEAQSLLAREQYPEAETRLRRLVERAPGFHAARDRLALCLIRQNRQREAVPLLEEVLRAAPGNADSWNYLAACRLVTGDETGAVAAFAHALELDPNHVQALGGMVHLMESAGLGDKAGAFRQRFDAVQSRP